MMELAPESGPGPASTAMKRILLAAAIAALLLSCDEPVRHVVTLIFKDPPDLVTISTSTLLGDAKPRTPEFEEMASEQSALLAGRDQWSIRFNNTDPQAEQMNFTKSRGQLQKVDHSATLASDSLQRFFFDTPLSVTVVRGEGWAELTIYPGASTRATREQRRDVERKLALYSERAARYFDAVGAMYRYLDGRPARALPMFTALFRDDRKADEKPLLPDEEQALVDSARKRADALVDDLADTVMLNRQFDLVYNPFPAELNVVVPGDLLAVEGFAREPDGRLVIKTTSALDAVGMLEGKWISPDPLAVALRSSGTQESAVASIAELPRKFPAVVAASEVGDALVEKMRPALRYRVRWTVKAAAPRS
jgi:hypothetical protein